MRECGTHAAEADAPGNAGDTGKTDVCGRPPFLTARGGSGKIRAYRKKKRTVRERKKEKRRESAGRRRAAEGEKYEKMYSGSEHKKRVLHAAEKM